MGSGASDTWDVPDEWRDAAEEVRAHLCALRGGALFLSPADALQLVGWFEQAVPVASILRALERAAEARRQNRSRLPLQLKHAKPHLGRPTRGVFARVAGVRGEEPVFAPVLRALRAIPPRRRAPGQPALEQALLAISTETPAGGEPALRAALAAARTFLEDAWRALGEEGRDQLRADAAEALGDLIHLADEGTVRALVEEGARDRLRQQFPWLSAASLSELVKHDALVKHDELVKHDDGG